MERLEGALAVLLLPAEGELLKAGRVKSQEIRQLGAERPGVQVVEVRA